MSVVCSGSAVIKFAILPEANLGADNQLVYDPADKLTELGVGNRAATLE